MRKYSWVAWSALVVGCGSNAEDGGTGGSGLTGGSDSTGMVSGSTGGGATGGPTSGVSGGGNPTSTSASTSGGGGTTVASGGTTGGAGTGVETSGTTGIDPDTDPLEGIGDVELVESGFMFTEGPLWRASEGDLLFSDIPANTIYSLVPGQPAAEWRAPSGNSNGIGFDAQGLIVVCEHSNRRVTRTAANGDVFPIAETYDGKRFNSPNDNITRSDGTVYFTDPSYGIPQGQSSELMFRGVFRVDPGGTVHLIADDMNQPNGIALSPDESTLYVADSEDDLVRSWPVQPDGSVGTPAPFADLQDGGDGMAVDDVGNLYFTSNIGVQVFKPDGSRWGTIDVPEAPTNASFGGPDRTTLYITARESIYAVVLNIPGLP